MTRGVLVAVLLTAACWTGSEPPPTAPPVVARPPHEPLRLRVKLERTGCFGTCPAYVVVIHGDGRVDWTGHANVVAVGSRQGRVSRHELEELSRRLDQVQFFERNEHGDLPAKPECTTAGNTTSCSFGASFSICSDTSHTIVSVTRGGRSHTIDFDDCSERPELQALEEYIGQILDLEAWIGP